MPVGGVEAGEGPLVLRDRFERDGVGDYCGRCGATAAREVVTINGCPHCRSEPIAWAGAWRVGAYGDDLRDWVLAYKFGRAWGWGGWFGGLLADAVNEGGAIAVDERERSVVVPVPLHWTRRMRRTYDQAQLLGEAFAKRTGLPLARLLRRTRRTRPQSTIKSKSERAKNVSKAFAMRKRVDLSGYTVWLIDDVKTTGATARVCAHLLRRHGAAAVKLAVVAVADPKGADFTRG